MTNPSCQLVHSHYFKKGPTVSFNRSKLQQSLGFGIFLFWFFFCFIVIFFPILGASWPELSTDAEYFIVPQEGYVPSDNNLDVKAQQYKYWYTLSTGLMHNPHHVCSVGVSEIFVHMDHQDATLKNKVCRCDHITTFLFEVFFLPLMSG